MRTDLLIESLEKHIVLTPDDKALIYQSIRERKVKKNQFVVHEGACPEMHQLFKQGEYANILYRQ